MNIHKHDHDGRRALSYQGTLIQRDARAAIVNAIWVFPEKALPYATFSTGDLFIETFYLDRWHNVFEVRGADGRLKGWYANVTRPNRFDGDNDLIWEDLLLDAWMSPDGHAQTLDEDEFEALSPQLSALDRATAVGALAEAHADLRERWRAYAVNELGARFSQRGWTLATAESCTGGGIGDAITAIPDVSSWFRGGIIAYHNDLKQNLLGVPEATLIEHGAVSAQTAAAMARGARAAAHTDVGISATGVAGPGGGTAEKPVGLVYIGVSSPAGEHVARCDWPHDRAGNKSASVDSALRLLLQHVS